MAFGDRPLATEQHLEPALEQAAVLLESLSPAGGRARRRTAAASAERSPTEVGPSRSPCYRRHEPALSLDDALHFLQQRLRGVLAAALCDQRAHPVGLLGHGRRLTAVGQPLVYDAEVAAGCCWFESGFCVRLEVVPPRAAGACA